MFGAYAFGQPYFSDGPAGTAIIVPGPREVIRLQATIRRSVDAQANIRGSVNSRVNIRRRVDLEVER